MGKKSGGVRIKQVAPKMPSMPMNFNPMEELMQIPPDEMIHLPPPVNRKYQVFWPIHESFTMKIDKFQVIYPNYLDANKTIKQGRRIGVEMAVPLPTVSDLSQALQLLGLRHVIQPYKGYSPDPSCLWDNPGRCLVDVSTYSKKELLGLTAARIRTDLPDRRVRLQHEADVRTKEQAERVAAATAEAAAKVAASNSNLSKKINAISNGSGANKKKAKGKRK